MNNKIASIIKFIAWLTYFGGFFAGILLGRVDDIYGYGTEFSMSAALIYWVAAFISGTVFLGFGEIIALLQKIVDKDNNIIAKEPSNVNPNNPELYKDLPEL